MEANNSMIGQTKFGDSSSISDIENKKNDITINISFPKSKAKTSKKKGFEIICKSNKQLIFEKITDEFIFHLTKCDECLKELVIVVKILKMRKLWMIQILMFYQVQCWGKE